MPSYVKNYRDKEKCRRTRNRQRAKNYNKTAWAKNGWQRWQQWELELILLHEITDFELSGILKRSVQAIQSKRYKLNKEENKNECNNR